MLHLATFMTCLLYEVVFAQITLHIHRAGQPNKGVPSATMESTVWQQQLCSQFSHTSCSRSCSLSQLLQYWFGQKNTLLVWFSHLHGCQFVVQGLQSCHYCFKFSLLGCQTLHECVVFPFRLLQSSFLGSNNLGNPA